MNIKKKELSSFKKLMLAVTCLSYNIKGNCDNYSSAFIAGAISNDKKRYS